MGYSGFVVKIKEIRKHENADRLNIVNVFGNDVVTSKDGLYFLGDDLVYRGEKVKNNVKFAGANWKIMKISNNKIYFGEITFTNGAGFDKIKPFDFDLKMGKWLVLN